MGNLAEKDGVQLWFKFGDFPVDPVAWSEGNWHGRPSIVYFVDGVLYCLAEREFNGRQSMGDTEQPQVVQVAAGWVVCLLSRTLSFFRCHLPQLLEQKKTIIIIMCFCNCTPDSNSGPIKYTQRALHTLYEWKIYYNCYKGEVICYHL